MSEDNPKSTQKKESEAREDVLLTAYREVCNSYHAVDDFRAKLLALLPIVSGAGGILLLAEKDTIKNDLFPIGLFGLAVTIGLFFYELRGIKNCGRFIGIGKKLEKDLKLTNAMFGGCPPIEKKALGVIGARTAGWVVYLSVIFAWIYVASVGFKYF